MEPIKDDGLWEIPAVESDDGGCDHNCDDKGDDQKPLKPWITGCRDHGESHHRYERHCDEEPDERFSGAGAEMGDCIVGVCDGGTLGKVEIADAWALEKTDDCGIHLLASVVECCRHTRVAGSLNVGWRLMWRKRRGHSMVHRPRS